MIRNSVFRAYNAVTSLGLFILITLGVATSGHVRVDKIEKPRGILARRRAADRRHVVPSRALC